MKRILCILLLVLLLLPLPAQAASTVRLSIDDQNLYVGMEKTYSQGYTPTVANGVATIVLPLITSGTIADDTIRATPNLGSAEGSPFVFGNYQRSISLSNQSINNGTGTINCYYVRFELALAAGRKNGVFPVVIDIEAFDANGDEIEQSFTTYVTITDGSTTADAGQSSPSGGVSGGPSASKPVLMVTSCTVKPSELQVNERFGIDLTIQNVGRRTAHNIRVSIESDDPNIILLDDFGAQYLRALASNKENSFAFDMRVLPMALGGIHVMTIKIQYESTDNAAFVETAQFRIDVEQPMVLTFDEIKLPEKATSGESFTLPVAAYNAGLSHIYNVKCSLEVPGLIAASAYLGNLAPEETAEKSMAVFVTTIDSTTRYGTSYGYCLFSYEDADGIEYADMRELTIDILEPVKLTDEEKKEAEEKAEEQATLSQWWVSLLLGLAIIAILVAVIIVGKFSRMMKMR